ncbi:MAG: phenylacetate--CoA ligase [Alphaproteobacteria bacterium]|nr:phenylacetate--CoA ligase [Alphaproteobacteria bacterium]
MQARTASLGNPDEPRFMYARDIETMPRLQLAALQRDRLHWSLAHAYENVPYYARAFDDAGVQPADCGALSDLARFPFVTKEELRTHYPFGLFAVTRDRIARLHASSGTTGKPTVVGYTAEDLDIWADLMARSMAAAGVRPGDLVHNAYGYGLFTGGLGAHDGAQRLGCAVVPVSGGNTEKQVLLLQDFGARVLCATPSYALNIAEFAALHGIDLKSGPLAVGIFGAEPWSEAMRRTLQYGLGITACDMYGLSEIMGPGVAGECTEQQGLHGWEDHFLFEIIDPETATPLPMGETGELVITTLTKQALPMIRYRTRDITRLTDEPCACGRSHLRILRISGRNDDMLIIRGVNIYPSQIEAVLVDVPEIAPHYQLVVSRDGTMDALAVLVEAAPSVPEDDAVYQRIAKEVQHHIKSLIGLTCEVIVTGSGRVPRSQGKAVRVRDLRG